MNSLRRAFLLQTGMARLAEPPAPARQRTYRSDYEIVYRHSSRPLSGRSLGARSARSISASGTSSLENQHFSDDTNYVGASSAVPGPRRGAAGFFQALG